MKRIFSILVAILVVWQILGCVAMSTASQSMYFDAQSKTGLVIFGVSPSYRVGVTKGLQTESEFNNSDFSLFEFNIAPAGGYVVSAVSPTKAGEVYAMLQILPNGFSGPAYKVCNGLKSATFQAEPGKVVYLGEFNYYIEKGKLKIRQTTDIQKAAEYLKVNYPHIQVEPVYVEPTWLTVKGLNCNAGTISIPVVLPSIRR